VATGVFSWTTSDGYSNTTNQITLTVTDDGDPPLTSSNAFAVIVQPRPAIFSIVTTPTNATLTWSAVANSKYQLLSCSNLLDTGWLPVGTPVIASNSQAAISDAAFAGLRQRFYRVQVIE
jgi:hypothetical protein